MKRTAWLLLLALLEVATSARADPPDESLTREGIELRRTGRDAEALAVFERALAVDGAPRTRAQVALAEQALGLWVEAERDLSTALSAGDDAWFLQHRSTLQSALEAIRVHLATLNVEANVAGAELWVNGSPAGTLPLRSALRVVAGTITIEVRAPGFEPQTRTVHVAPQTHSRELIDLARISMPQPAPVASALPEAAPVEPPRPMPQSSSARPAIDEGANLRIGAWASLAGGVALLAGAGVALVVRNTNVAMYNDDARCFHDGMTRDQRCSSYRQAASMAQTIAAIEFNAAAVAAAASVVLFTLAPSRAHVRGVEALQCTLGVGITCSVSF